MHRPSIYALLAAAALLTTSVQESHGQQPESASSRRTVLTKQRQNTLQELSQVAKERKELQQADLDAERQQAQLGPQYSFQKQSLVQQRSGIVEALKDNAKHEAALNEKLRSLDDQLKGL
jgi:cytochrome c556